MLLLLAHVMSALSLLFFGFRTGGYPVHPVGVGMYLTAVTLTTFTYAIWAPPGKKRRNLTAVLLLLSLPAFLSLVLQAGLWLTPWLGGALYAPWDPGDKDRVIFFSLLFTVLWSLVAVFYGSYRYLLIAGLAQFFLYFACHALPHWLRYPAASIFGIQPDFPLILVGIFSLAAVAIKLRNRLVGTRLLSLWPAVLLVTAVGGWVLFVTIAQFPGNGAELGWTATLTTPAVQVPANAWNWLRPAGGYLAIVAMTAVPLILIVQWLRHSALHDSFRQ